jgi:hypothetical protein
MPGNTHPRRKLPAVILRITKPLTIPSSKDDRPHHIRSKTTSSKTKTTSSKMTSASAKAPSKVPSKSPVSSSSSSKKNVPPKPMSKSMSKSMSTTKPMSKPMTKSKSMTMTKSKSMTKSKPKRVQRGGMAPICSDVYNPSKMSEPAVISGMASRGTTNAPFNSTTPTAELTTTSFDQMYTVFPSSSYPPIAQPLPYFQAGGGCGCNKNGVRI